MTSHSDEYLAYLQSPWWRARRQAIIKYRGARCEVCGCRYELELHHKTYERLGRERPEDVELLCTWCHQRRHGFTEDQNVAARRERKDIVW